MDFSEKLLTLRKSKDLTQEQLAERLNVSRQSVSKWESGQTVPELEKIIALSEIFDVLCIRWEYIWYFLLFILSDISIFKFGIHLSFFPNFLLQQQ